MICVSINEVYSFNYLKSEMNIELVEIRMDKMKLTMEDVAEIFSQPITLIATCRPGIYNNEERKEYLVAAIEAGARYVDIEVESGSTYRREIMEKARTKGCKVIISFHDYEKTPPVERLKEIVSFCFKEGADIAKVACKANSSIDCARLLGLLGHEAFSERLVVVGMGEKGKITRIVSLLLGSPFTYASYTTGQETAEGQIEKDRLEKIMRSLKDA